MNKRIKPQNIKIGEHQLNEESMAMVLPNWLEVITQIEQIRETAVEVAASRKGRKEDEEKLDFNNVISILGERGSGKSSVMLTLRRMLMKQHHETDVFLDVIVPEMLEDTSDILGVILLNIKAFIDTNKERIEKYYKKQRPNVSRTSDTLASCIYQEKTKLDMLWDKVFSLYIYRKKGYNKVIEEHFSGVSDYTQERKEALVSELELTAKLGELFDTLIEVLNGDNAGKHLIFVFFDDVDLNPKRCNEVLNVVLKYFNHPNIVTFISGDILKFQEDMISELLLQQGSYRFMNNHIVKERIILDSQRELVYDFLKKIMPYSRRFSLRKLTNSSKMDFAVFKDVNQDATEVITMKELVGNLFDEAEVPFYYTSSNEVGEIKELVEIPAFFQIFDDKPRGLLNVYSYLLSNISIHFDESSKKIKKRAEFLFYCEKLFEIIIETNLTLRENQHLIKQLYTLNSYQMSDRSDIVVEIHHQKLRFYAASENKLSKKEWILIVHFLYFVECWVTTKVSSISGKEYGIDLNLVLGMSEYQRLIPATFNVRDVFAVYSRLNGLFEVEQMQDIYSRRIYSSKYIEIINNEFSDYSERFFDDPVWLEHYESISNNSSKMKVDIIIKILEDFKDISSPIHQTLFDEIDFDFYESRYREVISHYAFDFKEKNPSYQIFLDYSKREIYNSLMIDFEDYNERLQTLVDLTVCNYFATVFPDQLNEVQEKSFFEDILKNIHNIIWDNRFIMKVDLYIDYDNLMKLGRRQQDEFDFNVENAIQKLGIFQKFLVERMNMFIINHSKQNETILLNRLKEKRARVVYSKIIAEGIPENIKNYLHSFNYSEQRVKDLEYRDLQIEKYHDFSFLIAKKEDLYYGAYVEPLIYLEEGMKSATRTKSYNAFRNFAVVNFYSYIYEIVNNVISKLNNGQLSLKLNTIAERRGVKLQISDGIIEEMSIEGENIEKVMEIFFRNIGLFKFSEIAAVLTEDNALLKIYRIKDELLSKFDELEEQYSNQDIDISRLNTLINKFQEEQIVLELRGIQRKLLSNGQIKKIKLDGFVRTIEKYLNEDKNHNPIEIIEIKELLRGLIYESTPNEVSQEIRRVENDAKRRVYQEELEFLIQALAYLYNKEMSVGNSND
ncbi:hypothetical protein [Paenibacillus sp. KS-LC4]|uniref:hypothetical protein n=1 Tax=Paenibacillus sp. KS-LC4 TaxID=2979727 RepID=UPI0030D18224